MSESSGLLGAASWRARGAKMGHLSPSTRPRLSLKLGGLAEAVLVKCLDKVLKTWVIS